MDEHGIRLVLARASELRSKITNCIHTSSIASTVINGDTNNEKQTEDEDEDDDESLLNIRDALESLEAQLSSLQALQQQQCYEKEAFLAEIDYSRKKLLQKLKEYQGNNDLEIIKEATAFASSTVEIENNDLVLPPYPNRPSTRKILQNGNNSTNDLKGIHQSERSDSMKRWKQVVGAGTKTVLTLVGFVVVMSLSGFEPRIRKMSQEHKGVIVRCPNGKVLVVEGGETRCLVKERVEIPFVPLATTPNVNYGCG